MNARKLVLAVLVSFCTVAGGLLFSGAAAQAALTHSFVGSFGPAGLSSSPFSGPLGVAVDQSTGDVYVYDRGEANEPFIYKFNSAGEPQDFSGLGTNVIEGSGEAYAGYSQIAVDSSNGPDAGDIYVVEGAEHVTVYGVDGDRLGELNSEVEEDGAPWGFTCGVAVDPAGNVYVGLYESHVNKYAPSGNPVSDSDYVSSLAGLPEGSCNLAADAEGNVYVTSEEGRGPVSKYEALQFGSLAAVGTEIAAHGSAVVIDPAPSDDDLYVDEGESVAQYDSFGALLGRFGASGAGALSAHSDGVAINHSSGEVYVSDPEAEAGKGLVNIYGPGLVVPDVSLEPVSALRPTSATLNATVNSDNAGNATCEFQYATSGFYEQTRSYEHTASCPAAVPSGDSPVAVSAELNGLTTNTTYDYRLDATNANGTNYSEDAIFTTTGPPAIVNQSSEGIGHYGATIKAQINPGGLETRYHFEYGTSTSYGTSVPVPDGTIAAGFSEEGVSATLTSLAIGTTYHFRVVATNADSPTPVYGPDQTFMTVPPALIEEERVSEVTADSVTLNAGITPLEGNDTHYYFQYGTTSCTASPSPCADMPAPPGTDIGSEEAYKAVSTHIQNLAADTTYYYRTVATNALGTAYGTERTFKTQSGSGEGLVLPDGRAWELVSPPDKEGATIEAREESGTRASGSVGQGGVIEASAEGGAITYIANAPIGQGAGNVAPESNQIVSTRGSGGWSSQDITTPPSTTIGVVSGLGSEYRLFTPDLSMGLVEPWTAALLSPEASEGTIYLRDASGGYTPLVSAVNTPAGTKLDEALGVVGGGRSRPYNAVVAGASPDLRHVVFQSSAALTSNAIRNGERSNLYEWTEGQLRLVSVLPDGALANAAASGEGGNAFLGGDHVEEDSQPNPGRGSVSDDGSYVIWNEPLSEQLYMRDTARGETVQIDAPQGAPQPAISDAHFQAASSEGSRIFFTDGAKLTADSTAGEYSNIRDLYEFEVTSGGNEPLAGKLTDLTVDEHAGKHADVFGDQVGDQGVFEASEDGSYVYFTASGLLAAGAAEGQENLYVLHDTGATWTTTFISAFDGAPGHARVSPDGRYLAFESDNRVSLYDASTNRVTCVSCNQTGEEGGSASLPGWTDNGISNQGAYQSRYLSNSGRLFFETATALVPQDTNGVTDVYEYEPDGVGSCDGASETFSEQSGGCVGLISSGTSSEPSTFLDASESGDDVFFLTLQRLVPEDYDNAVDVYDAHVCSATVPCHVAPVSTPACTTADACRQASAPQPGIFGAPPSATFSGAGDIVAVPVKPVAKTKSKRLTRAQELAKALKACKKNKQKHKRVVCEARARKRYAVKSKQKSKAKAKKSTNGPSAKRSPSRAGRR